MTATPDWPADPDTMTIAEVAEWRRLHGGQAAAAAVYERIGCVVLEPGTLRYLGTVVLVRPTAAEMRRRGLASWTREDGDV